MKFLFTLTLLLFVTAFTACQGDALKTASANKTVSTAPEISAAQFNSSSNQSAIKIGYGTGLVTKINLEIGSVELNHDEIKGIMPAMQMEFYVTDKKELESLKVADQVTFILEDNKGAERITKISKIE